MALPTRRSLAQARRVLATRLDSLTLVTTTSIAPDAFQIVSTDLALALGDSNRYRNQWAYVYDGAQAGLTRKIGDLALTTSTGALRISPVAFPAAIQNNVSVEIHKRLPPSSMDGYTGLKECLNMALRELWAPDRLSVAAVSNQATYDLGSLFAGMADWLDPQAVAELYGPQVAAGLNIIPWGGFDVIQDAETIQLEVAPGLTSGQTTTLEITRPGSTYIRLGGTTWTDNQDGFTADADESLFRPEILSEIALCYAYEALANASEGTEQARWEAKARAQRTTVNAWKMRNLPSPPRRDRGSRSPLAAYGDWSGKDYWT